MNRRRKIEWWIIGGGLSMLALVGCQSSPEFQIHGDHNTVEILIDGNPSRGGQTTDANADLTPL